MDDCSISTACIFIFVVTCYSSYFLIDRLGAGADLERGANHSSGSMKQGVWGHSPPEAIGYFVS